MNEFLVYDTQPRKFEHLNLHKLQMLLKIERNVMTNNYIKLVQSTLRACLTNAK